MATMTKPTPPTGTPAPTRDGWKGRALIVLAAVAAALAVWTVARVAGVDLTVRHGSGGGVDHVGAAMVTMVSAVAGLAGWGLLALAERFGSRAGPTWTTVAIVVLVLSLAGPLGAATSATAKAALACVHLAVAAALIPGLSRKART